MKVLIVSDTHGRLDNLQKAIDRVEDFDYLIHCGDVEEQQDEVREMAGVPCTIVRGNNDWDSNLPMEAVVTLQGIRIFVTHGHKYSVYYGTDALKKKALEEHCRIAIYGHTHVPVIDESDPDLMVLNPGSLTFPRQDNRRPSYLVLEITKKGQLLVTDNYLGEERRKHRFFW